MDVVTTGDKFMDSWISTGIYPTSGCVGVCGGRGDRWLSQVPRSPGLHKPGAGMRAERNGSDITRLRGLRGKFRAGRGAKTATHSFGGSPT